MTRPIADIIECKSDAAPPAIVITQAGALRRGEQKLRASALSSVAGAHVPGAVQSAEVAGGMCC